MLGATVPAIGGYHLAFDMANEWKCECIQIYITPSRTWNVPELSQEEIIKFKTAWKKSKVKEVVPHIPYLVNLASPNQVLWNKSIERLKVELSRADEFGISLMVLHPGSCVDSSREEGIERVILAINKVLEKYKGKGKLLLETMPGQGTMIGSKFEELGSILNKIKKPQSTGVCFDTGHIFMSGYDIRGVKGYKKILSEFDKIIGLKKIKAIHLNDSKTDLGSRVDRHACIGKGKIGLKTFQAIVKDKRFENIPKILEIPERDTKTKDNLKLLRKLRLQGT